MTGGAIEGVEPGTRIDDRYEVLRVLGEGGMGIVVAAHDHERARTVALKIVRRGLLDDEEAVQRFQLEQRALASLHSDHIVRVLGVGWLGRQTPFMVMEFLEGADLGRIAEQRGELPITEVVGWVIQACSGLAEAHNAGIVHRDLKPGNLFLSRRADGTEVVKVLDFGIAKSVTGGPALTKEGYVLGSPDFMSPEQLSSSKALDARTDVWALGAILYTLLGGRPPFDGRSLEEQLRAILAGKREPLRALRPDVPRELEQVIDRCLSPDVDGRLSNVAELARELVEFAPKGAQELALSIRADPSTSFGDLAPRSVRPVSHLRPATPRRKLALAALVVLVLAALVTLATRVAGGFVGRS